MKWRNTIIVLFFCLSLHAQHVREIGLFVETGFSPTEVGETYRSGIQYKRYLSEKIAYRLSASVGGITTGYSNYILYKSNDTLFRVGSSSYIQVTMPIISTGIQSQLKLSKHFSWYYGTDVNVGYSWGKKDSITFYDYASAYKSATYPTDTGISIYASSQLSKVQANMLYMGLQPFTGISAKWNRINTGIEISGLFVGSILETKHASNNSMKWGSFNARIFVNYSLSNTSKKSAPPKE